MIALFDSFLDHAATLNLLYIACQFQVLEASLDRFVLDTDSFAVRNAVATVALRPDHQKLPACLRTYHEQQGGDGDALPSKGPNISMVSSAIITSRLPWDDEDVYLEIVRANPESHGKPFYDCVSIESGDEAPWYAQLVALFSNATKPLAFTKA